MAQEMALIPKESSYQNPNKGLTIEVKKLLYRPFLQFNLLKVETVCIWFVGEAERAGDLGTSDSRTEEEREAEEEGSEERTASSWFAKRTVIAFHSISPQISNHLFWSSSSIYVLSSRDSHLQLHMKSNHCRMFCLVFIWLAYTKQNFLSTCTLFYSLT